tara:strand:+ start:160 stop:816 length:657 start_codon:yes stop_codon:yes gene_type:complete
MAEFLRTDIDPLEKLVYFKTRYYYEENKVNIKEISIAERQLEILLNCLDFIERLSQSIKGRYLTVLEKSYELNKLISYIKDKFKEPNEKIVFSEKLIFSLMYFIKDECTIIQDYSYLLDYDKNFSINNYISIIEKDKILKNIYVKVQEEMKKSKIYVDNELFNKCYEIFTSMILFNYKLHFRDKVTKYHLDNFKILFEVIGYDYGFNNLGDNTDSNSI